jgi:hypothetical protein
VVLKKSCSRVHVFSCAPCENCFLYAVCKNDQVKEDEMCRVCSTKGVEEECI